MKELIKHKFPQIHRTLQNVNDTRIRTWARIVRSIADIHEHNVNKKTDLHPIEAKVGWSFVVITDGKVNERLREVMRSIERELSGSPYEIIIVGPLALDKDFFGIPFTLIPYRELNIAPGLITKKKNIGVAAAIYDKVVITHDYVALDAGWKKGFDQFGSDWDVCMTRVVNSDGTRWKDWLALDFPGVSFASLPYDIEMTKYQYISGTYFVVKRNFYAQYPLDEHLRWNDGEDGEWSQRVREVTTFKMNTASAVKLLKYKDLPAMLAPNGEKIVKIISSK